MMRCQVYTFADNNQKANNIRRTQNGSFQDCIDECAKEPSCLSMDYTTRPEKDHSRKQRIHYKVGGGPNPTAPCLNKTVDTAYVIDPPEENVPAAGGVAGSTECPSANGNVVRGIAYNTIINFL
jgi:hypothetical protein